MGIRLGLCCIFSNEPIKFRRTTARYLLRQPRKMQLEKLSEIILHNTVALKKSLEFCHNHGIGAFRINSQLMPLKTHPEVKYQLEDLPECSDIISGLNDVNDFSERRDIRLTFHPDQFIHLSSDKRHVTENSIQELEHQNEMAELVGADVVNIHGGGAYGDKPSALKRIQTHLGYLSPSLKSRLTFENDDRVYTPEDLLPVCIQRNIPLVYDIHHHRCNQDNLSEQDTTLEVLKTWNREPLFHISSPIDGWDGKNIRSHHDFLNPEDFPVFWRNLSITVDIEAKLKEVAVIKLMNDFNGSLFDP